jgi:hypothetical protein
LSAEPAREFDAVAAFGDDEDAAGACVGSLHAAVIYCFVFLNTLQWQLLMRRVKVTAWMLVRARRTMMPWAAGVLARVVVTLV